MSINRRLVALERKLDTHIEVGICRKCRDRHITIYDDEPIPDACKSCGMIAQSIMLLATSEQSKVHLALEGKCNVLFIFPDDGRDQSRLASKSN